MAVTIDLHVFTYEPAYPVFYPNLEPSSTLVRATCRCGWVSRRVVTSVSKAQRIFLVEHLLEREFQQVRAKFVGKSYKVEFEEIKAKYRKNP